MHIMSIQLIDNVYQYINTARCYPSRIQPPTRIEPKEVKVLRDTIMTTRQIVPIEVMEIPNPENPEEEFLIVNGTRRWQVAKELGIEGVPVVIVPNTRNPNIVWIERNSGCRQVTGQEFFFAWANNPTVAERRDVLKGMPSSTIRKDIETFIDVIGSEEDARAIGVLCRYTPKMAQTAKKFAHLAAAHEKTPHSAVSAREVLRWMIARNTKRLMDDVCRHHHSNITVIRDAADAVKQNVGCQWVTTAQGAPKLRMN
jgi:hypothetical protein